MSPEEWRVLFEQAAEALADRTVYLRFVPPPTAGFGAESYLEGAGLLRIDMDPRRPLAERYRTLLHEAAHGKLHLPKKVTGDPLPISRFTPSSEPLTAVKYEAWKVDPIEKQADDQADKWEAWAKQAAAKYLTPDDDETVTIAIQLNMLKHSKELMK
jgi:hypothetical protein